MTLAGRAIRQVAMWAGPFEAAGRRLRVRWFVTRVKIRAAWARSLVDLTVARDARIGRRVQIRFQEVSSNRLAIGAGAIVDDDVRILLLGGDVTIGPDSEVRRGCLLDVAGRLVLEGENVLSWGAVVHCADSVTMRKRATAGEGVTFADSSHYLSEGDEYHRHNVRTGPIEIGSNTWIGAKATLARGVTIGERSVVAANSLVTSDVPAGHLASGVPAEVVRPLEVRRNPPGDAERLA